LFLAGGALGVKGPQDGRVNSSYGSVVSIATAAYVWSLSELSDGKKILNDVTAWLIETDHELTWRDVVVEHLKKLVPMQQFGLLKPGPKIFGTD
tara:strand:+ start:428 stop:709 length:282 start_codon:yes stop_codon:yes gene_type:complete